MSRDEASMPGAEREPEDPSLAAALPAEALQELEARLGYTFAEPGLLRRALTHASSTADKARDNERLEFFGDAVIELLVCEYLFRTLPGEREGVLTEVKSAVVCRAGLAAAAARVGLEAFLVLGRGMEAAERLPHSILANAFEALVAAVYLDGGLEPARRVALDALEVVLAEALSHSAGENWKSLLQERLQGERRGVPVYRIEEEWGPDHRKTFRIGVEIGGEAWGHGTGPSKKKAEQAAAREALEALRRAARRAENGRDRGADGDEADDDGAVRA